MRVITYIVIQVNSLARTWLNALPGDKQWQATYRATKKENMEITISRKSYRHIVMKYPEKC